MQIGSLHHSYWATLISPPSMLSVFNYPEGKVFLKADAAAMV